jgi:hypothetical protein
MSKKPSFANLGARLAQKPVEMPPATASNQLEPPLKTAVATPAKPPSPKKKPRRHQPDGRRGILVRARPEAWKALKQIALDGDRTLQDVMTEAINGILIKNEKPPLA